MVAVNLASFMFSLVNVSWCLPACVFWQVQYRFIDWSRMISDCGMHTCTSTQSNFKFDDHAHMEYFGAE